MDNKIKVDVDFNSKFKVLKPLNPNFTLAETFIMALGKNRNGTDFEEDVVNDAIPTIYNIPVVARIYEDEGGVLRCGGHDEEIVYDEEENSFKLKSLTVPFGVLSSDYADLRYEDIVDKDGVTRRYLVGNIILWNRYQDLFETLDKNDPDAFWGQSMEILPLKTEKAKKSGYMKIKKFRFDALTILGRYSGEDAGFTHEPCFLSSSIKPLQYTNNDEYTEMFERMKQELSLCFNQNTPVNGEGGKQVVNENDNTTNQAEDFADVANASEQAQPAQEQTLVALEAEDQTPTNQDSADTAPISQAYSLTYVKKYESISKALSGLSVCADSYYKYYWLADFDDNYVFVERYMANTEIPSGQTQKGRMAYALSDENEVSVNESTFEDMVSVWLTLKEFEDVEAQREELEALKSYKLDREEQDRKFELEATLEKFSALEGDAEYAKIKENVMQFASKDTLEKECFALLGKRAVAQKEFKYAVMPTNQSDKPPYGGFIEKYSNK